MLFDISPWNLSGTDGAAPAPMQVQERVEKGEKLKVTQKQGGLGDGGEDMSEGK